MITTERRIKSELSQKISAQPLCGVVQRHRRSVQIGSTEQPDHSIAQIFLLQQHENGDYENNAQRRERREDRADILFE